VIPKEYNWHKRNKLFKDSKQYVCNDPYLFKIGADGFVSRCLFGDEIKDLIWHCHNSPYEGHYN